MGVQLRHSGLGLQKLLQSLVELYAQRLTNKGRKRTWRYERTALVFVFAIEFVTHHRGGGHLHEPVFHGFELANFVDCGVHGFAQLGQVVSVDRLHALLFGFSGDTTDAAGKVGVVLNRNFETHKMQQETRTEQKQSCHDEGHQHRAKGDGDSSDISSGP